MQNLLTPIRKDETDSLKIFLEWVEMLELLEAQPRESSQGPTFSPMMELKTKCQNKWNLEPDLTCLHQELQTKLEKIMMHIWSHGSIIIFLVNVKYFCIIK